MVSARSRLAKNLLRTYVMSSLAYRCSRQLFVMKALLQRIALAIPVTRSASPTAIVTLAAAVTLAVDKISIAPEEVHCTPRGLT